VDVKAALEYLTTETTEGINPDISRITNLCRLLGNPERAYPVIHITGTNGKTSTARMIMSILREAGFRTALYTSPHLVSYTERFLIDGEPISEEDFAAVLDRVIPAINETNAAGLNGRVTQFEALCAMAFLYFAEREVDVAVIEVGMGGRWDATNVVTPEVAVITNIALEHTDRLGTTIEAIAGEKAGIIKTGSLVVTGIEQAEAMRIIDEQAAQTGAKVRVLGKDFEIPDTKINLKGAHQIINMAMAYEAAKQFIKRVSGQPAANYHDIAARALLKADSPGRLEIAGERPLIVLDGAHNPAGAVKLAEAVKTEFDYDKLILVLGVLADKDVGGIVGELAPLADAIIATSPEYYRAMPAAELAETVKKNNPNVEIEENVVNALEKAKQIARPNDMILVSGSLYVIGEVASSLRSSQ
jgi:dihydrofolate synthase / folylpolyglutamate synthase